MEPIKRTYWIVNNRTNKYIEDDEPDFDGDWKENYPHTKGADWYDVNALSLWPHDTVNGMYFVYDLCRDGGLFFLVTDKDEHTREDIKKAKALLRYQHDVVSLNVGRYTKVR